ncbi:MAG TPA: hypothetical protein VMV46_04195 [Thermoanaerobaculia bacterium]|nr:hypothetical protein [Thermoanaerobaculia bacterium]
MESSHTTQQKTPHETPQPVPRHELRAGPTSGEPTSGRPGGADERFATAESTLVLWRRCATASEDDAWLELHGRLAGRIRPYLRHGLRGRYRLACPAEADDLEQEVYFRLLAHDRRGLRRCRAHSEDELIGYLLSVCRSVLASAVRQSCTSKRRPVPVGEGGWLEVDPSEVPAPELSPEDRALVADARRKVGACASHGGTAASRRRRMVLHQVLYAGYTSAELAPAVGLTTSAIDSMVSRVRRRAEARGLPFPRRPLHDCRAGVR